MSATNRSSSSVFLPPSQTRLVTIAAHVDHGKTTLADNLIEANGLISERLAGTLRYLDSDPEEQRRGITMRSSAIGLQHVYQKHHKPNHTGGDHTPANQGQKHVIHLYDSPGHTDFSREVSSAMSCCDTALLVVDAVEGMGPRTHQVFREAYAQQLVPILVLNKIDRLCLDLRLTPTEAYLRLRNLLETVNAAASTLLTSSRHTDHASGSNGDPSTEITTELETQWTFDPARNNVVFASALFGFGFTAQNLARALYQTKAIPSSLKPPVFRSLVFADAKLKGDKVLKWKARDQTDDAPIFAIYGLQPLWDVLEGVATAAAAAGLGSSQLFHHGSSNTVDHHHNGTPPSVPTTTTVDVKIKADTTGMNQTLRALSIGPTGSDVPSTVEALQTILTRTGANTEEAIVRSLLRRFRPLSRTLLDVLVEYAPSPIQAAASMRHRALSLQMPERTAITNAAQEEYSRIAEAVQNCSVAPNAPTVAHVYKFMAAERSQIRDPCLPTNLESHDEDHTSLILGVARVLSGSLKTGKSYYAMGPKHMHTDSNIVPKRAIRLYLLMGSSFVLVDEVPAGHLCGVYNLEDTQLKTITLSDSPHGMPLTAMEQGIRPLVKVNVEAQEASDTIALERGLRKLALADAAVEVTATAKGERLLACLGEIHLEQSILDLRNVYCGREIKLRISDPIVDFGETTDWFEHETDYATFWEDPAPRLRQVSIPPYNEEYGISLSRHGRMRSLVSGRSAAIHVRAVPLASSIYQSLSDDKVVENTEEDLLNLAKALGYHCLNADDVLETLKSALCSLGTNGNALILGPGLCNESCVVGVVSDTGEVHLPSIAAEKSGNSDIAPVEPESTSADVWDKDGVGMKEFRSMLRKLRTVGDQNGHSNLEMSEVDVAARKIWSEDMRGSMVAGFQLAVRAGPICEEPVRNVLVVLEGAEVGLARRGDSYEAAKSLSGGMLVAALRSGIRCALLSRPARLMEGHLRLTLHSSMAGLGPLYSVLNKRRGKVLDDSMVDGADLLMITALIPQAEAFGLAPELYSNTSGEVTAPELNFSHWDRLDVDPFWIPTSLEEREDFGELQMAGDMSTGLDNTALKYIRKVREQKGLTTDSARTVLNAEKQRTLKR